MMTEQAMRVMLAQSGFSNVAATCLAAGNGEGMMLKTPPTYSDTDIDDLVLAMCKPGGLIQGVAPPGAPAGAQALMIPYPGFQTPLHAQRNLKIASFIA